MNARLITSETDFGPVGPSSDKLSIFKVSEGVCAEHALEKASNLLEAIILSVDDSATGDSKFDCHYAFLTLHAAESAKAIIDALWATFQIGHEGAAE